MARAATKVQGTTAADPVVVNHGVVRFPMVHINEAYEMWMLGKGPFSRTPNKVINLMEGWDFKQGSTYVNGVEVTRAVRPKNNLKNYAMPGWAILRKHGVQLQGYTFFREVMVAVLPDKPEDHDVNRMWYLERMGKVMGSKSALWNKYRTVIAMRKAMADYSTVFDVPMPGPSRDEIAGLAHLKIVPSDELRPEDATRIVDAYVGLYGRLWADETDVVLKPWE